MTEAYNKKLSTGLQDSEPCPIDHLCRKGTGEAPALEGRFGTLTYAMLDASVGQLAAWLRSVVQEPGARVASWLGKTRLACLMPLACARAGFAHVQVNPLLKHEQGVYLLSNERSQLTVGDEVRSNI